jgi:hypothetical protein
MWPKPMWPRCSAPANECPKDQKHNGPSRKRIRPTATLPNSHDPARAAMSFLYHWRVHSLSVTTRSAKSKRSLPRKRHHSDTKLTLSRFRNAHTVQSPVGACACRKDYRRISLSLISSPLLWTQHRTVLSFRTVMSMSSDWTTRPARRQTLKCHADMKPTSTDMK